MLPCACGKSRFRGTVYCQTCFFDQPTQRLRAYQNRAKKAEITFELTDVEFNEFWQNPCTYCGKEIQTIGLDRVDNSKGYTKSNVVSCCSICNALKGAGSVQDFLSRCQRIARLHPC